MDLWIAGYLRCTRHGSINRWILTMHTSWIYKSGYILWRFSSDFKWISCDMCKLSMASKWMFLQSNTSANRKYCKGNINTYKSSLLLVKRLNGKAFRIPLFVYYVYVCIVYVYCVYVYISCRHYAPFMTTFQDKCVVENLNMLKIWIECFRIW